MKVECTKGIGFYPYIEITIILCDNDFAQLTELLQGIINKKEPTQKDIEFSKELMGRIIKTQR